ncbi:hypothetical protein BV898_08563 [Hypsibius exemplaris]|uniref:G-protein coupled receptors family 1 profile domain-containing protein n=1 Tax=Hypsibius exemplaris TaxID=2072580 RepID=A0A1W0WQ40_HYPEX|nr:hypothetical protein BV898_08563 [Hypsibius exemplaris]
MNQSANFAEAPSGLTIFTWFALSIAVSLFGCFMLAALLAHICYGKLTGSTVLIAHLMALQLLHCAVFFPILFVDSFAALTGSSLHLNCPLLLLMHISAAQAEHWASLVLAVNRYVAIALPHHYRKVVSTPVLTVMIIAPWVIGIGDTLPLYFGYGGILGEKPVFGYCAIKVAGRIYGRALWQTIGTYIPTVLMGIIYVTLFVRLAIDGHVCFRRKSDAEEKSMLERRLEKRVTMAEMLVVAYVWYCLCFLPGPIILTAYPQLQRQYVMLAHWTSGFLTLCGYAASPVIFLFLSSDYRKGVRHLFTKPSVKEKAAQLEMRHSDSSDEHQPLRLPVHV